MTMTEQVKRRAWAVRPYPNDTYRMEEFLSKGIVAIGWPALGNLARCDKDAIRQRLERAYGYEGRSLGQVAGVVDRFVNQIRPGDAVAVPDGPRVYFGIVRGEYEFHEDLAPDDEGYPHWIEVEYQFGGRPIHRSALAALLYDALKGRQSVFALPSELVWHVIENFHSYAMDEAESKSWIYVQKRYAERLAKGNLPGINHESFERAVQKVFSFYYPGLERLSTRNAGPGADTDLMTQEGLPGGLVVRIQVKCYQDDQGALAAGVVDQLRKSMEPGEYGIIVTTTNKIGDDAKKRAKEDPTRPVGIIKGSEFAELVFANLDKLDDRDLWGLGLRRRVELRDEDFPTKQEKHRDRSP